MQAMSIVIISTKWAMFFNVPFCCINHNNAVIMQLLSYSRESSANQSLMIRCGHANSNNNNIVSLLPLLADRLAQNHPGRHIQACLMDSERPIAGRLWTGALQ